jgi:hypothetical protein
MKVLSNFVVLLLHKINKFMQPAHSCWLVKSAVYTLLQVLSGCGVAAGTEVAL